MSRRYIKKSLTEPVTTRILDQSYIIMHTDLLVSVCTRQSLVLVKAVKCQGPGFRHYLVQHQGPQHLEMKLASHLTSALISQNSFLAGIVSSNEKTFYLPSECFRYINSFKLIILLWDKWCCDPHFIDNEMEAMSSHTYGRRERRESLQETAIKLTSSDTQSVPSTLIKPTLFKWCSQKKEDCFHCDNPPASFTCWSHRTTSWFCTHTICKPPDCSSLCTYVPTLKSVSCQLQLACYCY